MDGAGVAGEVFVVDGAGQEVGDGFLAAVRVVREAGAGVDGEVVEQEEGGEGAEGGGADGAADGGAGAFGLGKREEGCGEGAGVGHFERGAEERVEVLGNEGVDAGVGFKRRGVRDERTGLDVLSAYRRRAEMQTRKEKRIVFMKGRGGEGICSLRE